MPITKEQLIDLLRDNEFRGHFTSGQVSELLAIQIRQLREKYGWTQAELGAKTGMLQEAISRVENPDYRGTTISTLSKLADAFDVGLMVRFAPFTELLDWIAKLSPVSFEPASFEEELSRHDFGASAAEASAAPMMAVDRASNIVYFDAHKKSVVSDDDWCSLLGRSNVSTEACEHATA